MKKRADEFQILLVTVTLAAVFVGAAFLWHHWRSGFVVTEARYRAGSYAPESDLRCLIRAYPKGGLSPLFGGYYYGCEVRWRRVLLSSTAYSWDFFDSPDASECKVIITSKDDVLFILGPHHIRCSGINFSDGAGLGREGVTWRIEQGPLSPRSP